MKKIIIFSFTFFFIFAIYGQNLSGGCDSITVKELINFSEGMLGFPYDWGASGPDHFDCSGFIQHVFQHIGIKLPRVSKEQYDFGEIITIYDIRKGDLVFFISREQDVEIGHVGLAFSDYSNGDFQFIHSCSAIGVCFSNYKNSRYLNSYAGARRIIKCDDKLRKHQGTDATYISGAISEKTFPNDFFYYRVRRGEKLLDISRKYFVSVENLMKWNNLESNVLHDTRDIKIYLSSDGF